MAQQQQLKNLQEALNSLMKGRHGVMLNPTVTNVLPTAISHIARNKDKASTFEAILSQLAKAAQASNPKISEAAVSCILATAKLLVSGAHWLQLKGMIPLLKNIAGKENFPALSRNEAKKIIAHLVSVTTKKTEKKDKPQEKHNPVKAQEEQIFNIAESGDSELALKKMFNLVVSCAKRRDFFNAERLRDQIYKIDSMVVTEIIQLNEIIDTEKNRSIGKHDLLKWDTLREKMSEDEFSRLFYAMELKTVKAGTTIVSKGDIDDGLYFVHLGQVSVSYGEDENSTLLKTLEQGEVFGENFFDSSYWTVSLTAHELSKVLILNHEKFDELEKIMPELGEILQGFYNESNDIEQSIRLKKIERRKHERYGIDDRKVHVQVIGKKAGNAAPFKAQLKNISQGGLSFGLRITNKNTIRQLLGEGVKMSVPPATGMTGKFIRGTVYGVQVEDSVNWDCTVHVKFMKEIEYEAFTTFLY